jgi:hypothetical protein
MATPLSITGWHPGLKKIQMTKLVQAHAHLGLKDAKTMTDRVLDGDVITLQCQNMTAAREFAHELQLIGAIIEAPGLDPPLLSDTFVVWIGEEIVQVLATPMDDNQRLYATRQLVTSFVVVIAQIPPSERAQILRMLTVWKHDRCIMGVSFLKDKAMDDWMETIVGTLEGILEDD